MPRHDYRCSACGLEFEVSRSFAEASAPVNCPVDAAACVRILRMPTVLLRGQSTPSAPQQRPSGWSHAGHSHGGGAGSHSH